MSITYCIQITLKDKVNKNSVSLIINRAQIVHCRFYLPKTYEYFDLEKNVALDHNATVNLIMELYKDTGHGGPVIVQKDETQLLLSFEKQHENLMLDLTLFAYDWEKDFANGEYDKDFARYIELLLTLTQDFPIVDISIKRQ